MTEARVLSRTPRRKRAMWTSLCPKPLPSQTVLDFDILSIVVIIIIMVSIMKKIAQIKNREEDRVKYTETPNARERERET